MRLRPQSGWVGLNVVRLYDRPGRTSRWARGAADQLDPRGPGPSRRPMVELPQGIYQASGADERGYVRLRANFLDHG